MTRYEKIIVVLINFLTLFVCVSTFTKSEHVQVILASVYWKVFSLNKDTSTLCLYLTLSVSVRIKLVYQLCVDEGNGTP